MSTEKSGTGNMTQVPVPAVGGMYKVVFIGVHGSNVYRDDEHFLTEISIGGKSIVITKGETCYETWKEKSVEASFHDCAWNMDQKARDHCEAEHESGGGKKEVSRKSCSVRGRHVRGCRVDAVPGPLFSPG